MNRPPECGNTQDYLTGDSAGTFWVILCIMLQMVNGFTGTAVTPVRTSNMPDAQYLTIKYAFYILIK